MPLYVPKGNAPHYLFVKISAIYALIWWFFANFNFKYFVCLLSALFVKRLLLH